MTWKQASEKLTSGSKWEVGCLALWGFLITTIYGTNPFPKYVTIVLVEICQIKGDAMGLFTKKIGPVFLKENSDAEAYIEKLKELSEKAQGSLKQEIEKQIAYTQYGLIGESNIAFELKNSNMDMYILHDIYLECDDLSAQIDYIIITRKRIYVIECKNLIGNIEVNNRGEFTRTYELLGKKIKEGIYSPVTQNERHLNVLKVRGLQSKTNIIAKTFFEKSFDENYKSLVVLANPKTVLNVKYATKDIKEKIVRADQLISKIKEMDAKMDAADFSQNSMLEIANSILEKNIESRSDYAKKYEELLQKMEENDVCEEVASIEDVSETNREELVKRLKAFRLEQSRKEKIKPYYIFSDAQMEDIIDKNPQTKEDLLQVSGFGNVKVEKYGEEIVGILKN